MFQTTARLADAALRRSYLYVPSSSQRMLDKSLKLNSDVIVYDLEDSVAPSDKAKARENLKAFLPSADAAALAGRVVVRVNDISTPNFKEDVRSTLSSPLVRSLLLPKVHSAEDLSYVAEHVAQVPAHSPGPVRLVASIESAKGMFNIGSIASWRSEHATLSALMFAAEDYCADTGIIRTKTRQELLFARSQIVIAAKAFGLEAIDMVCVNYQDHATLQDECTEGRRLGFTGKQAIHPSQVETIQNTFVPTSEEILRAAKILHGMEKAHRVGTGAIGLEGDMIDAPMMKQAEKVVRLAKAAGLEIPSVE